MLHGGYLYEQTESSKRQKDWYLTKKSGLCQECKVGLTLTFINRLHHTNRIECKNLSVILNAGNASDGVQHLFIMRILSELEKEGNSLT